LTAAVEEMQRRRASAAAAITATVALVALPAAAAAQATPGQLYLNFSDGTETLVKADVDNAARNESGLGAAAPYPAFNWPGFADGSVDRRDLIRTITRRVHEAFLPYNILVTTTRPPEAPYTMVFIGGSPALFGFDARVAGVAPMDCGNVEASNVVFTFPTALRGNVHGLFATVAQEAAHAYGLEHTSDPSDLMFPRVDPAQRRFQDRASRIDGQRLCGREIQNSHERLLEILGAWPADVPKPVDDGGPADTAPPAITFEEPAPGATVRQPFVLRASVRDDGSVDAVTVEAAGSAREALRPPWAWSLAGFPPGPLSIAVTAVDSSGNRASATLEVVVADAEAGDGGCSVAVRRPGGGPGSALVVLGAVVLISACSRRLRRL
jgi:hypothetical protein